MSVSTDYKRPLLLPQKPLATIKIQSDETAAGYVIINESDFDPAVHMKHVEPSDTKSPQKSPEKGKTP